jgi:hypothetical protein
MPIFHRHFTPLAILSPGSGLSRFPVPAPRQRGLHRRLGMRGISSPDNKSLGPMLRLATIRGAS